MDRIAKKEREEATIETNLKAIKNMISKLDMSPKKATEVLSIDEAKQDEYLALLGLKA